jgi:hypothetical protein
MKILKSYNSKQMAGYFTNGSQVYELHIEKSTFWGLRVKNEVIDFVIPWEDNSQKYFDLWDEKIKNQTPLNIGKSNFGIADFFIGLLLLIIFIPIYLIDKLFND